MKNVIKIFFTFVILISISLLVFWKSTSAIDDYDYYIRKNDPSLVKLPVDLTTKVLKFLEENKKYIRPNLELTPENLPRLVGDVNEIDEEYDCFIFEIPAVPRPSPINDSIYFYVIYDKNKKKTYIINEYYDFNKISFLLKMENIDIFKLITDDNARHGLIIYCERTVLTDYIHGDESHEGANAKYIFSNLHDDEEVRKRKFFKICDNKYTYKMIEDTFIYPQVKLEFPDTSNRENRTKWLFEFVEYSIFGEGRHYTISGYVNKDNSLDVISLNWKQLFPKDTIELENRFKNLVLGSK